MRPVNKPNSIFFFGGGGFIICVITKRRLENEFSAEDEFNRPWRKVNSMQEVNCMPYIEWRLLSIRMQSRGVNGFDCFGFEEKSQSIKLSIYLFIIYKF